MHFVDTICLKAHKRWFDFQDIFRKPNSLWDGQGILLDLLDPLFGHQSDLILLDYTFLRQIGDFGFGNSSLNLLFERFLTLGRLPLQSRDHFVSILDIIDVSQGLLEGNLNFFDLLQSIPNIVFHNFFTRKFYTKYEENTQ